MGIMIPLGIESFAEMRDDNFYYIDKTRFIKELLDRPFKVNLITRPRRFGKSLTMSMLEDFFDISRDSRAHFEGLEISKETVLCEEWMNKWPVVSVTLKGVEGLSFRQAYGMLRVLISDVCKRYSFLGESERVNPSDRELFNNLMFRKADEEGINGSLALLTRMMSAHYGKQTILLIDEYDVPLDKANVNGYYREMLMVIRSMLGAALKTNPYLKFGVITGCLRINMEAPPSLGSKIPRQVSGVGVPARLENTSPSSHSQSIFTGLNNLVANTITMNRFDEGIGFTEPEVLELLSATGFADHADEVRAWYDGYRFGSVDVYCPWDVLNHVAMLMSDPSAKPRAYWESTSSNDVIYKLFENETFDVNGKFETLLAGGSIRESITEDLTYDSLEATEESLWSLLFMTGYLTKSKDSDTVEAGTGGAEDGYQLTEKEINLRIPNEEIKRIFRNSVVKWFNKNVQTVDRTEMFDALWNGDVETAGEAVSDLLFATISYHDYRESFYHAFVAGLFAGAGYAVQSNREYGTGRPDVVVKDKRKRRAMVFEVKYAADGETLEHALKKAVNQIHDRRYAEPLFKEGYRAVISYGIAFKDKDCMLEQGDSSAKL